MRATHDHRSVLERIPPEERPRIEVLKEQLHLVEAEKNALVKEIESLPKVFRTFTEREKAHELEEVLGYRLIKVLAKRNELLREYGLLKCPESVFHDGVLLN